MALSTQRAVSDGTLQDLLLEIQYIDRDNIRVFVDNVLQVEGVDYEWTTDTMIHFTDPIADTLEAFLRRDTEVGTVLNIFTQGATFDSPTMDENFKQLLFVAQEIKEGGVLTDLFNDVDMHGFTLRNLPPAVDPSSPVTLEQFQGFAADSAAVLRMDLSNTAKAGRLVAYKRSQLASAITSTQGMLDAQSFSLWEFSDQITDKPNPADYTTWDWAPAVYAAVNAPTIAGHTIMVHKGCQIKTTVVVDKSVRFIGSPFDYVGVGRASFFNVTDTALTMFRIRAHYVVFDGIILEGAGKTGTSMGIEVGDGVVNYDKFAFINDSYVFNFNIGAELRTQNWAIRQGSAASTCAVGFKLTGLPTTADRRNGYIQGANLHSCDVGIQVVNQWQVLGITDNDFNSCIDGISGTVIRSVIADNEFFNCSGSELLLTGSLTNTITGNMVLGATGAPTSASGISVTGETTVLTGNNVRNKGGHGIYAALSSSVVSNNIAVDNDFFDTTSFDGIHIAGSGNSIVGNVSRTTTGGGAKQRYGVNVASGTGNMVALNTVNSNKTGQINAVAGNTLFKNPGFVTENRGTASITAAATSVVVNHGLAVTPTAADINVSPISGWGTSGSWFVTTVTATTFTIQVGAAPGLTMSFSWRAGA